MLNRLLILAIVLPGFLLLSCEKGTKDEIPAYIHIDKISLSTDYSAHGSNRADIYDAWVYVDNQQIGAFELPATIPVLLTGKRKIEIRAGILVNDNILTRTYYPFFNNYVISEQLEPGKVLSINPSPVVQYAPNAVFLWKDDFETGISLDSTTKSTVEPESITDSSLVYEGSRCMAVTLDETRNFFELQSHDKYVLPKESSIYLELNYNSNMDFTMGVFVNYVSNRTQIPVKVLQNSEGYWKKAYIQLTSNIGARPQAVDYRIFLGGIKPSGLATGKIYFDNIKLIHN